MIRISPNEYISERFIQDYYGYNLKTALKLYKEKFPQFRRKELNIE